MPTFDHYPSLNEILGTDPPVGVAFLIASAARSLLFQNDYEYRLHPAVGAFEITGPTGTAVAVLMTQGSPIQGVSAQNGVRILNVDTALDDLTGLGPKPKDKLSVKKQATLPQTPQAQAGVLTGASQEG